MQTNSDDYSNPYEFSTLNNGIQSIDILPGVNLEILDILPSDDTNMQGTVESDSLTIAFVLDGEADIMSVSEGQSLHINAIPNTYTLYYMPNSMRSLSLMGKSKANMMGIDIGVQQFKQMLNLEDEVKIENILRVNECIALSSIQKNILYQMFHSTKSGIAHSFYLQSKALELLSEFIAPVITQIHGSSSGNCDCYLSVEDVSKIRQARGILERDMINPPHLDELSRIVGMNINKLKRGFSVVYNKTPYACLREARMVKAGIFLAYTDMNISQTAWNVGYTNVGHFGVAFLKQYGVNPKEYQQSKMKEKTLL